MKAWIVVAAVLLLCGCASHKAATSCPAGNCCRSTADCTMQFQECFSPGEDVGCGACMVPPNPCQNDMECKAMGSAFICGVARCTCNGELSCFAGCADDTGCGEGQMCGADHRCTARTCMDATGCPNDFDCKSSACVRRPCTSDDVCVGACVNGLCYEMLGFCSSRPA